MTNLKLLYYFDILCPHSFLGYQILQKKLPNLLKKKRFEIDYIPIIGPKIFKCARKFFLKRTKIWSKTFNSFIYQFFRWNIIWWTSIIKKKLYSSWIRFNWKILWFKTTEKFLLGKLFYSRIFRLKSAQFFGMVFEKKIFSGFWYFG